MLITLIILAIIILILIIYIFAYKRQILLICRQMQFHKNHESNILLSQLLFSKELDKLVLTINTVLMEENAIRQRCYLNNKTLTNVITDLSHDIRTPLTSLNGYFQLMTESSSPEEFEHYRTIIDSRIIALKEILDELFTYTKLQNTDYSLEIQQEDITKIVRDTLFSFYVDIKSKGIEPSILIPEHPILIPCSQAGMKRVMQNILKNCLIHGSNIIVCTLKENRETVTIIVENDSPDSDQIDIDHVFERFYKSDLSRNHLSTGLGLSITKELINKMKGTIQATKKDSLFQITITLRK